MTPAQPSQYQGGPFEADFVGGPWDGHRGSLSYFSAYVRVDLETGTPVAPTSAPSRYARYRADPAFLDDSGDLAVVPPRYLFDGIHGV